MVTMGCDSPPMYRQSIEWINADQTGSLGVLRLTQSDTGWLKGTGHFKGTIWTPNQSPLEFWDHAPQPHVTWTEGLIEIGPRHRLQKIDTQWQLDSHFDEWNLRLTGTCPEQNRLHTWSEEPLWQTEVHCSEMTNRGWSQSHEQSQMLTGTGWIIEHKGEAIIETSRWIGVQNPTIHLLFEENNYGLSGTIRHLQDDQWTAVDITGLNTSTTEWTLETSDSPVLLTKFETIGVEMPFQHIASWERWLTDGHFAYPNIRWQRAVGQWKDTQFVAIVRTQEVE